MYEIQRSWVGCCFASFLFLVSLREKERERERERERGGWRDICSHLIGSQYQLLKMEVGRLVHAD